MRVFGLGKQGRWRTERPVQQVYVRRFRLDSATQNALWFRRLHEVPSSRSPQLKEKPARFSKHLEDLAEKTPTARSYRANPGVVLCCGRALTCHRWLSGSGAVGVDCSKYSLSIAFPDASGVAKQCGPTMASSTMARKRAFKRAQGRAMSAEPGAKVQNCGRLMSGKKLGLRPTLPITQKPRKSQAQAARNNETQYPHLSAWLPQQQASARTRVSHGLAVLSTNLGCITTKLYDEFCRWLELPETVQNLDAILYKKLGNCALTISCLTGLG